MNRIHYLTLLGVLAIGMPVWADGMRFDENASNNCHVTATLVSGSDADYTILATPSIADGYEFVSWSDGVTTNPRQVTFTGDELMFRAVFAKTSDVHAGANGDVTITIQNAQTPSYWLTAVPKNCGTFVKWSNGAIANPLSYLESDGTRIPTFTAGQPDKTILEEEFCAGGDVAATAVTGECNTYQFTATPETGYQFLSWADGTKENPRTYVHSGGEVAMEAIFVKQEDTKNIGGEMIITIEDPSTHTYRLEAQAGSCSNFVRWSDGSTDNPYFTTNVDDIQPVFSAKALQTEEVFCEGGTITRTAKVCGYTLTATPASGYSFVRWEDNSTSATREVDLAEQDYTAVFAQGGVVRGTEVYATIQDAINAGGSDPVILISDMAENVIVNAPLTIVGNNHTIGDLTITNDGDLTLDGALQVHNLYLNAQTGKSSQLRGEDNLTYANAYIDITLEAGQSKASPDKWYAFSVPFEVDVNTGVARQSGQGSPLVNSTDYLIWKYDGQMRADNKQNGWVIMADGQMQSGLFYMIGIDGDENTWRFKKTDNTPLHGAANVALSAFTSSDSKHSGWNAVGNTQLTHVNVSSTKATIAQVYANGATTERYDVCNFSETSFVMASPLFIQTSGVEQMTLSAATHASLQAPTRKTVSDAQYYKVMVKNLNSKDESAYDDVVFLTITENAPQAYEIGKDVIKMVGGNTNTYMWTNANGNRLCAEDVAPINDVAEYSLSVYAPVAGQYRIEVAQSDRHIYLLENDIAIADLTISDVELDLTQGISTYVLRIGEERKLPTELQKHKDASAPSKYIYNGSLYIRNNGAVFNAQGAEVR